MSFTRERNFLEANLLSLLQFCLGLCLRRWEALVSLSFIDGTIISLSTLHTHLGPLGLFRVRAHSELLDS